MTTLMGDLQKRIEDAVGSTGTFDESLQKLANLYGIAPSSNPSRIIPVAADFDSSITTAPAALNYLLYNPDKLPTLGLDFINNTTLDSRITFTRALNTATYFNSAGLLTTANANVPRFDYDPSTLAPRGLLIEEARTNLLTYSEQFDNAAWTKSGTTTIVANDATAPDGTTTADRLVVGNGLATYRVQQNFAYTAGVTYSHTCYVKKSSYRYAFMYGGGAAITGNIVILDLDTGTLTLNTNNRGSVTALNNGWYRLAYTATAATTATEGLRIGFTDSPSTVDVTGNGASGGLLWGAQLEAGAFPTSYIPTTTTALTRNADVASVNTLSPWFNSAAGTLFNEVMLYALPPTGTFPAYSDINDGTTNNRVALSSNQFANNRVTARNTGGVLIDTNAGGSISVNVASKWALAYANGDYAGSANGGAVVTSSTAGLPSGLTQMTIGRAGGANQANGWIRRITYYPRRLSNAELQAITA